MSKLKTIFWVLILAFIGILIFQNQDYFLAQKSVRIIKYDTPALPTAVYFLIFFTAGLLISYLFGLSERFRLKKTIKKLSALIDQQVPKESSVITTSESPQTSAAEKEDSNESGA